MIEQGHGGDLVAATRRFGLPPGGWLDLSTGINPQAWPAAALPPGALTRLPQQDGRLEATARDFYAAPHLLPVPGSQAAIQHLPWLRPVGEVMVVGPTYPEHAHCWRVAGHRVTEGDVEAVEMGLHHWDVIVVVNPDNPTGRCLSRERLLAWHGALVGRGGWLVVDEAFAELTPEASLAGESHRAGLIVLRSLGKFFGLPGLRLGFLCAEPALLQAVEQRLGPWAVSGPARWWGAQALADHAWQEEARADLAHATRRLNEMLRRHGLSPTGGTDLFRWIPGEEAVPWQEALAREGVWTRRYPRPLGLRIGLPGEDQWARLERALAGARNRLAG